jgi:alpha-2-macroglobulin
MPKHKLSDDGFFFRLSLLSFLFIVLTNHLFILPYTYSDKVKPSIIADTSTEAEEVEELGDVLYWWDSSKPVIYIRGGQYNYSSGGLISLASTDDPVVDINVYYDYQQNKDLNAKFELYEADREALFSYLIYKDENTQVNSQIDTSSFDLVTTFEKKLSSSDKVNLPLKDSAIYLLKLSAKDVTVYSYIVRSNIASVVKHAGDELIFWSQDYRNKRSLSSGNVHIYNLKEKPSLLSNVSINYEGIAKTRMTPDADVAFVLQDQETAVVPVNLRYLNTGYSWQRFQELKPVGRSFVFSDRPLYRPGDTVYFKSIIRDEDDVRYSIPAGYANAVLTAYGLDTPVAELNLPISPSGSVWGEFKLPQNLKTGEYYIYLNYNDREKSGGSVGFSVQHFRKPEFFLQLSTDNREYIAGDKIEVTFKGEYFSGQPLRGVQVNYEITATDYYDYHYYDSIGSQISDDFRYGWWWGGKKVNSGLIELDANGQATISIDTEKSTDGKPKVYTIETHYSDASSDKAFDRKNVLVQQGEFGIYIKNHIWSVKAGEELSPVFKLYSIRPQTKLENRKVKVLIEGEVYEKGKRDYFNRKYEKVMEKELSANSAGEINVDFSPGREGMYKVKLESADDRGNNIVKGYQFYATDKNYARYDYGNSGLTLTPDKEVYEPGEVARVALYSSIPDRDVFLSFDRAKLNRYQVVKMTGNSANLELGVATSDMPNIYLTASSFTNSTFESASHNMKVSAERMRLQVGITTDAVKYKPGDTAVVDIETKDLNGNPVSAEAAVWLVDKSIYQLVNDKLGHIFDAFWFERYNYTQIGHSLEGITVQTAEGGGCFAPGTKILMADGSLKNIEEVGVDDYILTRESADSGKLVKARVSETGKKQASGLFIINGKLKITDNHKLLVNGKWQEAAHIKVGDYLTTRKGREVVNSIEWQLGKQEVYNLEIAKYHTFFADGIYVHNEKGGASREILEDTAYWNPSVWTGADGKARVNVKLPDNLTTWAISAVASTWDTKVGQQKAEVVVAKDIIIRPIIPNVLREGDEIVLSALAQNFTDSDKTFNIKLDFAEGEVEESEKTNILIRSEETRQVFWNVKPKVVKESADLRFVMYETNNVTSGDNLLRKLPVLRFGFKEVAGYAGNGDKEYKIKLNSDSVNEDSSVVLNLSATLLGSLPASMNYLIDYPYGCIEQTTSRFVPSVIVKRNQSLFPDLVKQKDVDGIINKGLARLSSLQNGDGSWSWWRGKGDAYITAYVIEYLLQTKDMGYEVDELMLMRAKRYMENLKSQDEYITIPAYYALTLLNSNQRVKQMQPTQKTDDFLLGMLIIANKKNGINDNNANGYNELVKRAKYQGETAYWNNNGSSNYFGSTDASTAMAIRAIIEVGGDRDLAVKAVNYLSRNRNNRYWTNTFGTAQAIRAITELSVTGDEQNPNYTYEVKVGDKLLRSGRVTNPRLAINEIKIPINDLGDRAQTIKVTKNGTGQMYSTLVISEFRTDRNFEPVGKALKITRKIVNSRDPYLTLGVGEVANIEITVEGLVGSNYLVVEDTLASGMVPVIESFKNEQGGPDYNYYDWGRDYKPDGVIFSRSHNTSGTQVLSYKARVINSGEFWLPPATAEVMYSPDINGQSEVDKFIIEDKPRELPRPAEKTSIGEGLTRIKGSLAKMGVQGLAVIILILTALVLILKKTGLFNRLCDKLALRLAPVIAKIKAVLKKDKGESDVNFDDSQETGTLKEGETEPQNTDNMEVDATENPDNAQDENSS